MTSYMYKYCAWGIPSALQYKILNFPKLQPYKRLQFFAPLNIQRLIPQFSLFPPTITVSTTQRRLLQRFDSLDSIDF